MHRFFIPPDSIQAGQVHLPEDVAHQIRQVLHLAPGDLITVLDNQGMEYQVKLDLVASKQTTGQVISQNEATGEPSIEITLYQSLTQRDKFEWILQKCTELGITACVPVLSTRSLVRRWTAEDERKAARWERIMKEAAEQSHRGRIPALQPVQKFDDSLHAAAKENDLCIIPWEEEHTLDLRQALQAKANRPKRIAVFIGPEGGFTPEEAAQANQAGIYPITLGRRILRVETAAMASIALVLYELGDM